LNDLNLSHSDCIWWILSAMAHNSNLNTNTSNANALAALLENHLKQANPALYTQLHSVLNQAAKANNSIESNLSTAANNINNLSKLEPGVRYLNFRVRSGRAFLDYLLQEHDEKQLNQANSSYFVLSLQFDNSHYSSRPVVCGVEPAFNESWLFKLQENKNRANSKLIELTSLVESYNPIYLALSKHEINNSAGAVEILSFYELEWRKVLVHGKLRQTLQLANNATASLNKNSNNNSNISNSNPPLGLLEIELEIVPLKYPQLKENSTAIPVFIEPSTVEAQLKQEKLLLTGIENRFKNYLKYWYLEYKNSRPLNSTRLLNLLTLNEYGGEEFICNFLTPMAVKNRNCGIFNPQTAARFVRLIPFVEHVRLGGVKTGITHSVHSIIIQRAADGLEHSIFLCNLLLGFGLNAFVVSGSKINPGNNMNNNVNHHWVISIDSAEQWTFYESLTGQSFLFDLKQRQFINNNLNQIHVHFNKIYSLFNHRQFFANNQIADELQSIELDLKNKNHWKTLSQQAISVLPKRNPVQLQPSNQVLTTSAHLEKLESELQQIIQDYRAARLKQTTHWNEELGYVLQQSLFSYESERVWGVALGSESFQSSIKHIIPDNAVFKAVPFQFVNQIKAHSIMELVLQSQAAVELLQESGEGRQGALEFSLRVVVNSYAENFYSVWLILASVQQSNEISNLQPL
jgi:centrosomal protein CEP76